MVKSSIMNNQVEVNEYCILDNDYADNMTWHTGHTQMNFINRLFVLDSFFIERPPALTQPPPTRIPHDIQEYSSDHLFAQHCFV